MNANLKFEEGKKVANEIEAIINDLNGYLNEFKNIVDNMTWQGNNAERFKQKANEIKESWDGIYKTTLIPVPNTLRVRIENYQQYENSN